MAQRELFARNAPREIVHQIFFAASKSFNDSSLLPLKWFAFKNLRNPPPQKIHPSLHVLLESVRMSSRKRNQAWPVGQLEIVHIATVGRLFYAWLQLLDHPRNRATAARAGKPADEYVVAGCSQFDAHLQRAQRAFLSNESFAQLRLRR